MNNTSQKIVALLGPTNTGKTYVAIEKMLEFESGIFGLPLRLLAREVYDKCVSKVGFEKVALITGEEKIIPNAASYFICTVESMPKDKEVDFVAIDEIQMCADRERGHVFTERLLHARGQELTMFLGSQIMSGMINDLIKNVEFEKKERLSKLSYTGYKKISRLERKVAIIRFFQVAQHCFQTSKVSIKYVKDVKKIAEDLVEYLQHDVVEFYQDPDFLNKLK